MELLLKNWHRLKPCVSIICPGIPMIPAQKFVGVRLYRDLTLMLVIDYGNGVVRYKLDGMFEFAGHVFNGEFVDFSIHEKAFSSLVSWAESSESGEVKATYDSTFDTLSIDVNDGQVKQAYDTQFFLDGPTNPVDSEESGLIRGHVDMETVLKARRLASYTSSLLTNSDLHVHSDAAYITVGDGPTQTMTMNRALGVSASFPSDKSSVAKGDPPFTIAYESGIEGVFNCSMELMGERTCVAIRDDDKHFGRMVFRMTTDAGFAYILSRGTEMPSQINAFRGMMAIKGSYDTEVAINMADVSLIAKSLSMSEMAVSVEGVVQQTFYLCAKHGSGAIFSGKQKKKEVINTYDTDLVLSGEASGGEEEFIHTNGKRILSKMCSIFKSVKPDGDISIIGNKITIQGNYKSPLTGESFNQVSHPAIFVAESASGGTLTDVRVLCPAIFPAQNYE